MTFKLAALVLLAATAFAAEQPIAPYFGVWKGEGVSGAERYRLTITMKQTGPYITGSYSGSPKGGGGFFSGSYTGELRADGCYEITVKPMSALIGKVQLTACLGPDKVITVKSMIIGGTATPSKDFTKCVVEVPGPLYKFRGTLFKKGMPGWKKEAKKTEPLPVPVPQPPLPPMTLEIKKN